MFASSGFFAAISCPFSKLGLCERPHCFYKHATGMRDMSGAAYESSVTECAGVQKDYPSVCGVPPTDAANVESLQELQRIDKEIETVKYEVEQEQRRLLCYRTVDASPNLSVSMSEAAGKTVNGASFGPPSCADLNKTVSRLRKYVVDNSKPRTDLEYDPMSNYSADFRSYRSSGREQKVKSGQGLKRARNAEQSNGVNQAQLSRSLSPEPLDDSYDDTILIIDIPPSPDRRRAPAEKPHDGFPDASQETLKELDETRRSSVLLDSPPLQLANAEMFKVKAPPAPTVKADGVNGTCAVENKQDSSYLYHNTGCEIIVADENVIDLTECLEDLQGKSQNVMCVQAAETEALESPGSPDTADHQDYSSNKLVIEEEQSARDVDLPGDVEKTSPQQPHNFPQGNFDTTVGSYSSCIKHSEKMEPPAQYTVHNHQSPQQSGQKSISKLPGLRWGEGTIHHACRNPEQAEPHQTRHAAPASVKAHLTSKAESPAASAEQLMEKVGNGEVIVIGSSSDEEEDEEEEEECQYSEMELSDSDPMEECYRIFMEANEQQANEEEEEQQQDVSAQVDMDVEKWGDNVKPQELPGKKRMAHEARHTEQPVAKSRPHPQVLVPLRGPMAPGFASQPSVASKIQQRASLLSASVKGGQAFVSSTCQRKQEIHTAAAAPLASTNTQPHAVQNAYMSYLPLGTTLVDVGNNLHLILPQGTFPLANAPSSSSVTPVLTPVSQMHARPVTMKQTYPPSSVVSVQRCRTTPPLLIPAPTRKPSLTSTFVSAHPNPANPTTPQTAAHAATKLAPAKRKMKHPCEAAKEKVPHDIRQRYVSMFTEEFLKTTANVNDAFEKALAEEKTVYNRSMNKLKYLSVAVNALKKLKNQNAAAARDDSKVTSQKSKGKIPLNSKKLRGIDDMALYESLKDYILTEEKLIENNYPVQHPERPGCAVLFVDNKKANTDPLKRICCRCGATYSVSQTGKHVRKEECTYHYGKGVENRVPGGVETRYSCCQGVMGAPGCQQFKLHVHDSFSLDGFLMTEPRHPSDMSCPGVYSVDCEMCYTIHGLELSRVTVVNSSLQVIYDTFVRPDNEVIDYNTRFSGICEEDVKGNQTTLKAVQDTLLSFINADTILIGHGLETDLCALKLIHGTVVDTSMVFPHRLGPPHKLTLNSLTAEYLRRIIQESVCGHDTSEDAAASMELMLWKVKDGKVKK